MMETIFDTSVLDKVKAQRQVEDEELRQHVLQATLNFLDEFGVRYGLEKAVLFGSILIPGRFQERSDVDLAVDKVEPTVFFDLMASLSMALGREVDLVDLSHCHFADQIRQKGLVWTKKR